LILCSDWISLRLHQRCWTESWQPDTKGLVHRGNRHRRSQPHFHVWSSFLCFVWNHELWGCYCQVSSDWSIIYFGTVFWLVNVFWQCVLIGQYISKQCSDWFIFQQVSTGLDILHVQAGVRLLPHPLHHRVDQLADCHDVWHLLSDTGAVGHWVEVWSGQIDQKHAENICGSNSSQSVHNMDGSHKKEISWAQSWQIQGKNEIQKNYEGWDYAKGSWHEVFSLSFMCNAHKVYPWFKVCCGGASEKVQEEEASSHSCSWQHEVGFCSSKEQCNKCWCASKQMGQRACHEREGN